MNIALPFLLADGLADALKALVPLLILAFWVFSQLADAKKQGGGQAKPQPRQPPQRPQRPAPAGGRVEPMAHADVPPPGDKPPEDNVRAEVEEFLRRVRQQGEAEQRPKRMAEPARRPRIEVLVDESTEESARPAAPTERKPLVPPRKSFSVQTAERQEPPPAAPPLVTTVPLERRHLAESLVADHARHLGHEISQSDERLEAHLHQKFDHNLGKLAARELTPAEQVATALATTPASEIAALMATPQGMQQAIVLGEILRRPNDRW